MATKKHKTPQSTTNPKTKGTEGRPALKSGPSRKAKGVGRQPAAPDRRGPVKASAKTGGPGTKIGSMTALLDRPGGASIEDLTKATGWQPHSVRGAISGTLKKKLGLNIVSEKAEGRGRVYRIAERG